MLVWIGETEDTLIRKLEDGYLRRVRRFIKVERSPVAEQRKTDPRQFQSMMDREADSIEKRLKRATYLVALAENGQELTTRQFAEFLSNKMNQGRESVAFIAGGHQGIPEKVTRKADLLLSLSRMTLPHEIARLVLLEQLYRALTIARGLPYHR